VSLGQSVPSPDDYYFNSYFELKAFQRHAGLELWMAIVDLADLDFRK